MFRACLTAHHRALHGRGHASAALLSLCPGSQTRLCSQEVLIGTTHASFLLVPERHLRGLSRGHHVKAQSPWWRQLTAEPAPCTLPTWSAGGHFPQPTPPSPWLPSSDLFSVPPSHRSLRASLKLTAPLVPHLAVSFKN